MFSYINLIKGLTDTALHGADPFKNRVTPWQINLILDTLLKKVVEKILF